LKTSWLPTFLDSPSQQSQTCNASKTSQPTIIYGRCCTCYCMYHRANHYKQSHGPLESLPNCLTRVCNVRLSSSRGCFNPRRLERLLHCTSNKVVLGRLCGRSQGHTSNDSNHVQTTLSHGCELMSQAQMRTAALAGPSSLRRQASRFTMLVASSSLLAAFLARSMWGCSSSTRHDHCSKVRFL